MDVRVTDSEALRARLPTQIYAYLLAHGWQVVHENGASWVWSQAEHADLEIWLPKRREIRGYPSRVAEIMKQLSEFEERPATQVLFEITNAENDVQRITSHPEGPAGTLPLEEGESTVSGLRRWVLSAATSVAIPDRLLVQPRRKPASVLQFMPQVRLVAPAEGSFVWTIMTPIARDEVDQELPFPDATSVQELNSFNRRVTLELYRTTRLAKATCEEVLQQPTSLSAAFQDRVGDGINANLCEALASAGGESRHPYTVTFNWASQLPAPATEPLRFNADSIRILSEAAESLRQVAPETDVTIEGFVVRLVRPTRPGQVTIAGIPSGGVVDRIGHYWAELSDEDYERAGDAHFNDLRVSIRGNIIRRGNRRWLSGDSVFRVLGSAE